MSVFARNDANNLVVRQWLGSKALFSERAAEFLSEEICSDQNSVDDVLLEHYVGSLTKLGRSVRASAASSACEYLGRMEGRRDDEWSLRFLQWITERVLSDLTLPDAFSEAVSSLILSDSAKRSEGFQGDLRSYIQNYKRLGDPRKTRSVDGKETAAGRRFLASLTARGRDGRRAFHRIKGGSDRPALKCSDPGPRTWKRGRRARVRTFAVRYGYGKTDELAKWSPELLGVGFAGAGLRRADT
jgi:hypothetical protein